MVAKPAWLQAQLHNNNDDIICSLFIGRSHSLFLLEKTNHQTVERDIINSVDACIDKKSTYLSYGMKEFSKTWNLLVAITRHNNWKQRLI